MSNNARPLAVVTGAARGIGLATTRQLALRGYHVLAIDAPVGSTMPYALSSASELEGIREDHIVPRRCDVRDADLLTAIVQEMTADFGALEVAVACAGVLAGSESSLELDPRQAHEIFDVDYWGVVHLATVTVPLLRRSHGALIAVSSAAGTRGLPRLGHYCAAKHAIHGFLSALAREEVPKGVRINIVAPGSTNTALLAATADVYELSLPTAFLAQQLDPHLNTPDDVANVICFLASNEASGINATVVPVDRGFMG